MDVQFNLVVIGGGPGGYVAAIRAAQLGKKVALIEKDRLGGICLNWGCIPTKSLLRDSEVLHLVKNAAKYGIKISDYTVDFSVSVKRSRDVSKRLSKGVEYLMKKNKITHLKGNGVIKSKNEVEVTDKTDKKSILKTNNIIIATGARNSEIEGLETDGERVITYKEALVLEQIPNRMIIIGAGAIGVEFASFFHEYGTEVHLVEMLPHILPAEDEEISEILTKLFKKRGIRTYTSTEVERIDPLKTKIKVHVTSDGKTKILEGDLALVAIGVQGNVENLGLEEVGVEVENSWIKVNEFYETSVKSIYAIGDVVGPPWLAHVASAEGHVAAVHISGKIPKTVNYSNIPGCTYCRPQVASIGMTEKEALEAGYEIKVGRFPFRASGKALAMGEPEGLVKVIFDAKYGELLGCHIIGIDATELIAEIGAIRTLETTYEEILNTIHAHPTISECFMEAVADAYDRAIHI
ncbi:MAG: dihydrolipoyl dehydrogenase [Candidatus Marinimicrobia bacterium]|nr:dihydrolipoyl dehydrogenase [Candidatus Neomarinimicrobiota bacterium]